MEPFIIEGSEFICSQNAFGSPNHITHCLAVILVGYFVVDGNVIFCINSGLYIIGYFSDIVSYHYLLAIGIRNGDLWFSGFFELLFQIFVIVFSLLLLVNLILYLLPVVSIVFSKCPGVLFKLIINIGYMPVYLSLVVIVLLTVLRPKLSTISGNQLSSDKIKMPCNLNCSPEDLFDGLWIVSPEIGNCVMIRFETL